MAASPIQVNRAPVLTLWAAIVAERLGFNPEEALSLGRAVAGLNAQAKGRRLGLFRPAEEGPGKARARKRGEEFWVEVCGRPVPAKNTDRGVRAVKGDQVIGPEGAGRYLESEFGGHLPAVRKAMEQLARTFEPADLEARAFGLYERFRPVVPPGVRGWGAKGVLDLGLIASLVRGA